METSGILYVATRQLTFLCEAIASAESVKALVPDVPISLFTDAPEIFASSSYPFDDIIEVAPSYINQPNLSWGMGLLGRIASLAASPYSKTLHLDTDTRVLSKRCIDVFGLLDDCSIALVPCTPLNSRSCRLYGPMFNGGVIAFRRDREIADLFQRWAALHAYHLALAALQPPGKVPYLARFTDVELRFLLTNDQTSLARLLSPEHNPHNIAVRELQEIWNARDYPRDRLQDVIVDHADCHKVKAGEVAEFLRVRGLGERSDRILGSVNSASIGRHGGTMTAPRDSRSLIQQLATEMMRDPRVVSAADRDLMRRVLSESTGDRALDAAVAQRVASAYANTIAIRVSQVIAYEVIRQLGVLGPLTPGDPAMPGDPAGPDFGPFAPSFPVPGITPYGPLGPIINPIAEVSPSNPGNDPATGPGVSPSNPGNDPATGPGVSPSNPGNDPARFPFGGIAPEFGGITFPGAKGGGARRSGRVPGVGTRGKKK